MSNLKDKQFGVLQGDPPGLAGPIPPTKWLQSSYGSNTTYSCSIIHEVLPGAVSQVPKQREVWLPGTGD